MRWLWTAFSILGLGAALIGAEFDIRDEAEFAKIVPKDAKVEKLAGGMGQYPGDDNLPIEETANCRCTLVAPSMTEESKYRQGLRFLAVHVSRLPKMHTID